MIESKIQFENALYESENNASIDCDLFYNLGYIFEHGLIENDIPIVDIDDSKAYHWYNKGSECGSLDASISLADLLSNGIGCKKSIKKAITLYKLCIEKGSSIAANNLGTVYRDLHEYQEAFKFYEISDKLMAKEYNKTVFSLQVALCHLYGIGTIQNIEIAMDQLIQLASDDNDYTCQSDIDEAVFILGSLYLAGTYIAKDIEKARYYLSKANIDGDHYSAWNLLNIIG